MLSVVAYHAFPSVMPGGFVGVDVFFVISGYLITGILLKEHEAARFSLVRFYERRARRLFPALAVVLAVTVLISFAVSHPSQVADTSKLGVASAFSTGNIALWRESGYFDTASRQKPLLNLWSLGVEEQFYLVWPLLLVLLLRTRRLVAIVVIGCLVSLASAEVFNETRRAAVFYLPLFRAWELGIGALLAIMDFRGRDSGRVLNKTAADAVVTLGVVLIVGSTLWLNSNTPFPGFAAVAPVVGSACVIWAGNRRAPLTGITSRALASRPFVYVGLISYSLYLWHWPLLSLPRTAGVELNAGSRLVLVALAFVLSTATFRWIESPARQSAAPRRAALISCGALVVAAMLCTVVYLNENRAGHSLERLQLATALEWPPLNESRESCPEELRRLDPPLAYCQMSGPPPAREVLWGDSHADHLFPGLMAVDPHRSWLLLGHMSCPPAIGIDVVADQPDCRERAESALRWIERQKTVETVVMSFFGYYSEDTDLAQAHRDGPVGPSKTRIDGHYDRPSKSKALEQGLHDAIARLIAANKNVIVVIDVPSSVLTCRLPDASSLFVRQRAMHNSDGFDHRAPDIHS